MKTIGNIVLILIAVFVFLVVVGHYGNNNALASNKKSLLKQMLDGDDEQKTSTPVIQVTTDKLCKDYAGNNEAKADIVYKDKKLLVTGVIGEISEIWESYSLELLTSDGSDYASANFNKKYINVLAELKKGQKYTVYCTCTGKTLETPMLRDCQPKS